MAQKSKAPATLREYKKWRNLHYGLKASVVPTALTPFAIELIANWSAWFPENKDGTSVGIGLAMALVSTFASVFALTKKDTEFMKKIGPFLPLAIGFIMWGAVLFMLSSVLYEMGKLLIFSGCGILGSAVEDAVEKAAVSEKYEYMKKLADDAGFTRKGRWQKEQEAQAEYDKEKYKEELKFIPHD